ncbi:MAG: bifunctional demethylmenaquinone methyltransferase/2-methoxy-6-polyprenyl-1,4-benzoquinol methylase UbiE [Ignavibacteriales bacterium]|nr:bifunctional demethylmenaquinone methyltransferase/2-methoxy-6-polyprenyl-1,4-benzoquinol methylase UbiE [Ignavibacteriales bacterium]
MRLEILAQLLIFTSHNENFETVQATINAVNLTNNPGGKPHKEPQPERQTYEQAYVRSLFDGIAYRYDFLNHFLSYGFDILWRKKAIRLLREFKPRTILDIATGTADLAIEAVRLQPEHIYGVDISSAMLAVGRRKIAQRRLGSVIALQEGQAEQLPFPDHSMDAVMVAFGVRNFSNLEQGLAEMHRVLKSQGVAMILEFSQPRRTPLKQLYGLYFRRILPVLGGVVSKRRAAYEYLPNTVAQFPDGEDFLKILKATGFQQVKHYPLTFGIATIYLATK